MSQQKLWFGMHKSESKKWFPYHRTADVKPSGIFIIKCNRTFHLLFQVLPSIELRLWLLPAATGLPRFIRSFFSHSASPFISVINYIVTLKIYRVCLSSGWSLCFTHALYLLQLLQNFFGTHPAGQHLLNHTLGFRFLRFFSSLLISGGFLGFQFT